MRNFVLTSLVGLSLAGTLMVSAPASATIWINYASVKTRYVVALEAFGSGANRQLRITGNITNGIFWERSPDPVGSGFWRFAFAGQAQTPVSVLAGGNVTNGTAVTTRTIDAQFDQHWLPGPSIFDDNGALCYIFFNRKNMSKVMGVSGGKIVEGQPVIMWDYFTNPVHPDQAWCAYTQVVPWQIMPELPPPF